LIDLPVRQASYAPMLLVGAYAMAAARHMHQYGTTRTGGARQVNSPAIVLAQGNGGYFSRRATATPGSAAVI
jgi:hypothetical protein